MAKRDKYGGVAEFIAFLVILAVGLGACALVALMARLFVWALGGA